MGASQSRLIRWLVVGLLTIAVVVLWLRYTGTIIGVSVAVDARPITCTDTDVRVDSLEDDSPYLHLVDVTPEMSCRFRLLVTNNTGHDVTVESITWQVMGPLGGTSVEATRLNPIIIGSGTPTPEPGDVDAIWDRRDVLEPSDTTTYEFTIEYRREGCASEGATLIPNLPTLEVRTWFLSTSVGGGPGLLGFVEHDDSSC
jgi:hypothetical protein